MPENIFSPLEAMFSHTPILDTPPAVLNPAAHMYESIKERIRKFECRAADGGKVSLLQHYSQVNILLTDVSKKKKKCQAVVCVFFHQIFIVSKLSLIYTYTGRKV